MKQVLLIDSDLGFAFWLGKALDRAGYEAYPARNIADGLALLSAIPLTPHLVIFGETLGGGSEGGRTPEGVSSQAADGLIAKCREWDRNLRVIWLRGESTEGSGPSARHTEWRKPDSRSEENRAELLHRIDLLLRAEPAQSLAHSLPIAL